MLADLAFEAAVDGQEGRVGDLEVEHFAVVTRFRGEFAEVRGVTVV